LRCCFTQLITFGNEPHCQAALEFGDDADAVMLWQHVDLRLYEFDRGRD
jgi:hypothetical protein